LKLIAVKIAGADVKDRTAEIIVLYRRSELYRFAGGSCREWKARQREKHQKRAVGLKGFFNRYALPFG
jgi:hypothetical protein